MAETVLDPRGTILARRLWLAPGEAMPWQWDEPTARVHRAVNVGEEPYGEVKGVLLDRQGAVPQPQPADDAVDCAGDQRDSSSGRAAARGLAQPLDRP